jgi:hypothetical protein
MAVGLRKEIDMRRNDRGLAVAGAVLLASLTLSGCYDHYDRPGHSSDRHHRHDRDHNRDHGDHGGYGDVHRPG